MSNEWYLWGEDLKTINLETYLWGITLSRITLHEMNISLFQYIVISLKYSQLHRLMKKTGNSFPNRWAELVLYMSNEIYGFLMHSLSACINPLQENECVIEETSHPQYEKWSYTDAIHATNVSSVGHSCNDHISQALNQLYPGSACGFTQIVNL